MILQPSWRPVGSSAAWRSSEAARICFARAAILASAAEGPGAADPGRPAFVVTVELDARRLDLEVRPLGPDETVPQRWT
ncbi:hypothetical protein AB0K16_19340 [Nonomuraea jabiensis]|uniref:hypothetical protein n=1 Tax=Nonomuraea jabiensis TaxID=882448 RepID=UPI003429DDE0